MNEEPQRIIEQAGRTAQRFWRIGSICHWVGQILLVGSFVICVGQLGDLWSARRLSSWVPLIGLALSQLAWVGMRAAAAAAGKQTNEVVRALESMFDEGRS